MIETSSVRVDYDGVNAVSDLDLQVGSGEIFGLIGPNGAGKTSTIRVLATLLEPTYGDVRIGGFDIEDDPEAVRALLGYMPDWAPVHDDLKVWEFLDLFASSYGIPRSDRRRRIAECIEVVDLVSKWDSLSGTLSRGMKQRLALAKTLLHRPRVLLLDEPASGLDPKARIDLRNILRRLMDDQKTILVSSHILTELADFCTSVGIMEKGRMVVSGRVDDIIDRMTPHRRIVVRLLEPDPRALAVIREHPGVVSVDDSDVLDVAYEGDDEGMAALLARLTAGGVRVLTFQEEKPDLEDIFMQVGAQEVS